MSYIFNKLNPWHWCFHEIKMYKNSVEENFFQVILEMARGVNESLWIQSFLLRLLFVIYIGTSTTRQHLVLYQFGYAPGTMRGLDQLKTKTKTVASAKNSPRQRPRQRQRPKHRERKGQNNYQDQDTVLYQIILFIIFE